MVSQNLSKILVENDTNTPVIVPAKTLMGKIIDVNANDTSELNPNIFHLSAVSAHSNEQKNNIKNALTVAEITSVKQNSSLDQTERVASNGVTTFGNTAQNKELQKILKKFATLWEIPAPVALPSHPMGKYSPSHWSLTRKQNINQDRRTFTPSDELTKNSSIKPLTNYIDKEEFIGQLALLPSPYLILSFERIHQEIDKAELLLISER